jgi:signal transduction histidine kinase/HPt (histidine-containing phosphotransfer) domain-containing protein/ActR/RegA family two-component response regulator
MSQRAKPSAFEVAAGSAPRGHLFRKYLVSFVAVASAALVVNGAIDAWFSYQEQKHLLIGIQREQADSAAGKIGQFIGEIERQISWFSQLPPGTLTREDRRLDAIRLLRLSPAIAEVAQLDAQGREQLRISRQVVDTIGSQKDLSDTPAFRVAKANGPYYGPIYFFRETEPFMTLAAASAGPDPTIIVAEVNLRFIWDLVTRIKVGTTGSAFVVDKQGELIAHPDLRPVLRKTDLFHHPVVHAALSGSDAAQGGDVVNDLNGQRVLSTYAPVASLGWLVLVELPISEAYASIYSSIARSALLFLGLLGCAIFAALLLSRRMIIPIQALMRGAARIGSGDLDLRLAIHTGDELEALGGQFNQMAAQLRESYATLERKVLERTTELAQARDQALAEHAEAQRAREAAEQANETKSRFLAVVSHELRTPLNGVMGVLQLLDDGRLAAAQRRHLMTAAASGETLIALIDAILEYARLEAGTEVLDRRTFHLGQLIGAAVDLLRPQAETKGLTLEVAVDISAARHVGGDSVRLNRVLLNLVGNAVKFTERGRIDIAAALVGDGAETQLRLSVRDTGIGIAPQMLGRIFEDFVQADDSIARRFGGTGLGLAISRRVARQMGGDLTVESAPDAGSTFRLCVPLSRATEPAPVRPVAQPGRALNLLLVDDDPINREVGTEMLLRLGHTPAVATDGPSAVRLAQLNDFDAVLMDLHMPGMDGIEAATLIESHAREPKPRIIILTADMSERSRERLSRGGFHDIVSKPILLDALRCALGGGNDGIIPRLASAPPVGADDLVDATYFAGQQDLLGAGRLRALRCIFAESAEDRLRTIAAAARGGDRTSLARAAHQLASAAGALALSRLFECCNAIEREAAAMSVAECSAAASDLAALYRDSLAALDERLRTAEVALSGAP